MPRLSWNEIETRAAAFADRWQGETYEKGESQTFWSEFLTLFGSDRRSLGRLRREQRPQDVIGVGVVPAKQSSGEPGRQAKSGSDPFARSGRRAPGGAQGSIFPPA